MLYSTETAAVLPAGTDGVNHHQRLSAVLFTTEPTRQSHKKVALKQGAVPDPCLLAELMAFSWRHGIHLESCKPGVLPLALSLHLANGSGGHELQPPESQSSDPSPAPQTLEAGPGLLQLT